MIAALLILHALVGLLIIASGDRFGRRAFAIAAVAPLATVVWMLTRLGAAVDGDPTTESYAWIDQIGLSLDFRLDALGAVMVLLVSGIGLLVCVYATGYFSHPTPGTARLAGLLTLFAGAMLGVVLTDHLLSLFVFWELTSITSYLLIGNDDTNPRARDAALTAILITGAGGLALLAGLVMVGQSAGTYRLSELIETPIAGDVAAVGLVFVLIGAFTKSAQLPFAGWLPGAMVAPTPISTYLHAATMVKAGVYLVARLSPILADVGIWRPLILIVSSVTMIVGGWRALRQHDLKLLLAYGTVSQLGFMMLLFGMGEYELAQAGIVVLLAHGAFKAALFMVVGIVDHEVGTRDIRRLHGFGPSWRPIIAVSAIAAASMAGVPPMLGFVAKEKGLDGALHGHFAGAGVLTAALVVGSVLTFAYSARFVLGVLGRFGTTDADAGTDADTPVSLSAPAPRWGFAWPPVALAAFTLVAGLAPIIVDALVRAATTALDPEAKPKHVVLWAGFNQALMWSAVIIAAGVGLTVASRRVESLQHSVARVTGRAPDADRVFWATVTGTLSFAKRTTRIVQNGSLPVYLMIILGVTAIASAAPALWGLNAWPDWIGTWTHVPIAIVVVGAALGATVVRRRIAAALLLGAVGFALAGFYVSYGAPDLALTQFAIETLATVLFVLVLRFLPRQFDGTRAAILAPIRLLVSIAIGASVFVLALVASSSRSDVAAPSVSEQMLQRSVPDGKGSNVVNVILVDFRGFDTLGEITVLLVAGLGLVALARAARRPGESHRSGLAPIGRMPVVDASSRLLYASILTLSLYFLFAGHNQPGGGFVGGLTAGAAISLRYVAGGVTAVRNALRFKPWTVLGTGLLIATATAITPLVTGNAALEHADFERELWLLGKLKVTSALPFDIGVYLIVIGLVLMAYEGFGQEAEWDDEAELARGATSAVRT